MAGNERQEDNVGRGYHVEYAKFVWGKCSPYRSHYYSTYMCVRTASRTTFHMLVTLLSFPELARLMFKQASQRACTLLDT